MPSDTRYSDACLGPRRAPIQDRSRKRVELILDIAAELVAEVGVDGVKTSEIARRAEITLASLYRYFPNKTAIFESLARRQLTRLRGDLANFLEDFDLDRGLEALIATYARNFRNEAGYAQLWAGIQAIPELAALDLEDLHENARLIADSLHPKLPHLDHGEITHIAMVVARSTGAILRLGLLEEDSAPMLQRELELMLKAYLRDRLAPPG